MKNMQRQIRTSILLVVMITLLLVMGTLYGLYEIDTKQKAKTNEFLVQMNAQYKTAITRQITGDMETLQGMVALLGAKDAFNQDELIEVLEIENANNRFMRMGYIDREGIAELVDIDGSHLHHVDLRHTTYFQRVMRGEKVITNTIKDEIKNDYINVYAVPIYRHGKITGALYAANKASVYRSIVDLPSLGNGFAGIIDGKGKLVIRSKSDPNQSYTDIFDLTFVESDTQELRDLLEQQKTGSFRYQFMGKNYLVNFSSLGINDWLVMSVVPETVLVKDTQFVSNVAIAAVALITFLLSALLLYIFIIISRSRKALEKIAYYDEITDCYTKNKFVLQANTALKGDFSGCLILIDIDHFKMMNELFGYQSGDKFLKYAANCLHIHLHEGELYYRHSADCFGLLLREHQEKKAVERLDDIVKEICRYEIEGQQRYHIFCHCGIKMITPDEASLSLETLIDRAMMALKECKKREKEWYYLYDKRLYDVTQHDTYIESRMVQALEAKEFDVYLQPKYDINQQCITGAEALVRWRLDGQLLMPDDFIPIFERNGFITKLDMYVLDKACSYMEEWDKKGYRIHQINVNQSRLLFYHSDYLKQVEAIIQRHHVDPCRVVLEVTESVALENTRILQETIQGIHDLGLQVSMDDFGSGYSSLNVLQELPFDELKLDQVFIKESMKDVKRQKMIVQKIIELSRDLHIRTVAEGVETMDQLAFLQEIDCDIAQGYYFSKPIEKEAFDHLLQEDKEKQQSH